MGRKESNQTKNIEFKPLCELTSLSVCLLTIWEQIRLVIINIVKPLPTSDFGPCSFQGGESIHFSSSFVPMMCVCVFLCLVLVLR